MASSKHTPQNQSPAAAPPDAEQSKFAAVRASPDIVLEFCSLDSPALVVIACSLTKAAHLGFTNASPVRALAAKTRSQDTGKDTKPLLKASAAPEVRSKTAPLHPHSSTSSKRACSRDRHARIVVRRRMLLLAESGLC